MAGPHVWDGELTTFSLGGSAYLELVKDANLAWESATEEGASVLYGGSNIQETKRRGRIECSLFQDVATGVRLSHLDLSLASLGAVNLLSTANILNSLAINIKCKHQMKGGAGEAWEHPVVTGRDFSATLDLDCDSAAVPQPLVDFFSTTYADRDKTLTFTLNGVAFSLPMRIIGAGMPVEQAGKQHYTLSMGDRSAYSGQTVSPSGTTSLIQKIFNAYKTAITFSFQAAAAKSISATGNAVFDSLSLEINNGILVPTKLVLLTQGTVTGTAVA